jgi:hypothetical protein
MLEKDKAGFQKKLRTWNRNVEKAQNGSSPTSMKNSGSSHHY